MSKKYKNSALKPYAGSSHSKRNRIKLEKLTRKGYGTMTSKRDKRGNYSLVQKDNFGIKQIESEENIQVSDAGNDTKRSKTTVLTHGSLARIEEEGEGGAVVPSKKFNAKNLAIDHFKGRRKYFTTKNV